jgi:hypothetical protein
MKVTKYVEQYGYTVQIKYCVLCITFSLYIPIIDHFFVWIRRKQTPRWGRTIAGWLLLYFWVHMFLWQLKGFLAQVSLRQAQAAMQVVSTITSIGTELGWGDGKS